MLIKFKCLRCRTVLEAASNSAGKIGACPKCGKTITVPNNNSGGQIEKVFHLYKKLIAITKREKQ